MLTKISQPTARPVHIDEVKRHLIIEHSEDDLLIESYIDSAVQWIENHCDRALVQQSWWHQQDSFCTKIKIHRLPVLAVDSIQYIDSDNAVQIVTDDVYRVGFESGRIFLKNNMTWPTVPVIEESVSVYFQSGYLVPLAIDAASNALSAAGIGFSDNQVIMLSTSHTMPGGINEKTPYFVINSIASNFQISTTQGGEAVDISDIGAGDCFIGELSSAICHALLLLIGFWYENRESASVKTAHEIPMGVESLLQHYRVYA